MCVVYVMYDIVTCIVPHLERSKCTCIALRLSSSTHWSGGVHVTCRGLFHCNVGSGVYYTICRVVHTLIYTIRITVFPV